MGFFRSLKEKIHEPRASAESNSSYSEPPAWAPAPEVSHEFAKLTDAPAEEFEQAEIFCANNPVDHPRLLPSHVVDRITKSGCKAWGIEHPRSSRFIGSIQRTGIGEDTSGVTTVITQERCQSVCLLSDLPIIAGLYDTQGKSGVYYELLIKRMDGIIAIGTACRPYPDWRFPGWNRLSAAFHLDDFRKFFEDPEGGRDYTDAITSIRPGDTVGCGYEISGGILFYTYNGMRLPPAFQGIHLPRHTQDVFAAIGVEGHCEFEVNFGGDVFRWKEGNEWGWRVEGHVGRLVGSTSGEDDELPAYNEGF